MRAGGVAALLAAILLVPVPFWLFAYQKHLDIERSDTSRAVLLDSTETGTSADPCRHTLREVTTWTRSLVEGQSINISLRFLNSSKDYCRVEVRGEGLGFDVQPGERVYSIAAGATVVYWPVTAQEAGEHSVTIAAPVETRSLGFVVRPQRFPSRTQSLLLAIASSATGALILTSLLALRLRRRWLARRE
jgi:hypothetical protein